MPGNLLGASRPGCISSYGKAAIVDVRPSLSEIHTGAPTDALSASSHTCRSAGKTPSPIPDASPSTSRHMSVSGGNRGEQRKKAGPQLVTTPPLPPSPPPPTRSPNQLHHHVFTSSVTNVPTVLLIPHPCSPLLMRLTAQSVVKYIAGKR
jgi:hypothetical protein